MRERVDPTLLPGKEAMSQTYDRRNMSVTGRTHEARCHWEWYGRICKTPHFGISKTPAVPTGEQEN